MVHKSIAAAFLLTVLSPLAAVLSQGVNVPAVPSTDDNGADRVIVTDVPIEENILPTSRPTDSVYGTDTAILDTPRNATIISREQLSAIDIQDPRDFSKLTSDSYTQSNFGAPANPSIRGQTADVFINGMRRGLTSNGNGFPINFNSIESVDIIKGTPDAVYGASQYTGGYVDEITKQPYFDKFQGEVGTTIGEYQVYRWEADFGGPLIKDKLAYRISYTGEDSGSYYDYTSKESEAIYGALTWTPTLNYRLQFNSEFEEATYNENNGINRVTQDLIDNDHYITGQVIGGTPGIQAASNPVVAGPTVNIDHAIHIIGPQDGSYGRTFYAQIQQTLNVNEGIKLVNNTLFEYINRHTFNAQQFDEYLKDNSAIDNRFEFIWDTDIPITGGKPAAVTASKDAKDGKEVAQQLKPGDKGLTFHNELNTGVELRFQNNTNYETFAFEPFDAYDLTGPMANISIPTSTVAAAFPGNYHIPGTASRFLFTPPGTGGTPSFDPDSARSKFYEAGPFLQDQLKFTDQLSLFFGGRADIVYVDAESPPGTPADVFERRTTTQVIPNANISPTYKPFPWMTTYFTYNFSESTNTGNGGDYSPDFGPGDYHQQNRLYEIGSKFSLLRDTLFFTATAYLQHRINPNGHGASIRQNVDGLEFEADYQPNKHIYATTSYSLLDSHSENPGFIEEALPIATGPVKPGTVLQTDVQDFEQLGNYLTPGYPVNLFNGLVSYKTDFGLGASADIQVTSPINVSYLGNVKVPWQYNVDLTVFYRYKFLEGRVGIYNVTNQHNWNPANPIYGNESIFAEEPIHVEGTVKIFF